MIGCRARRGGGGGGGSEECNTRIIETQRGVPNLNAPRPLSNPIVSRQKHLKYDWVRVGLNMTQALHISSFVKYE